MVVENPSLVFEVVETITSRRVRRRLQAFHRELHLDSLTRSQLDLVVSGGNESSRGE